MRVGVTRAHGLRLGRRTGDNKYKAVRFKKKDELKILTLYIETELLFIVFISFS